jgi:hypothetical protein
VSDARSDIIELSDYVYERTRSRLARLTDEEYFWEPAPGCCTIRRADPGCVTSIYMTVPSRRPAGEIGAHDRGPVGSTRARVSRACHLVVGCGSAKPTADSIRSCGMWE